MARLTAPRILVTGRMLIDGSFKDVVNKDVTYVAQPAATSVRMQKLIFEDFVYVTLTTDYDIKSYADTFPIGEPHVNKIRNRETDKYDMIFSINGKHPLTGARAYYVRPFTLSGSPKTIRTIVKRGNDKSYMSVVDIGFKSTTNKLYTDFTGNMNVADIERYYSSSSSSSSSTEILTSSSSSSTERLTSSSSSSSSSSNSSSSSSSSSQSSSSSSSSSSLSSDSSSSSSSSSASSDSSSSSSSLSSLSSSSSSSSTQALSSSSSSSVESENGSIFYVDYVNVYEYDIDNEIITKRTSSSHDFGDTITGYNIDYSSSNNSIYAEENDTLQKFSLSTNTKSEVMSDFSGYYRFQIDNTLNKILAYDNVSNYIEKLDLNGTLEDSTYSNTDSVSSGRRMALDETNQKIFLQVGNSLYEGDYNIEDSLNFVEISDSTPLSPSGIKYYSGYIYMYNVDTIGTQYDLKRFNLTSGLYETIRSANPTYLLQNIEIFNNKLYYITYNGIAINLHISDLDGSNETIENDIFAGSGESPQNPRALIKIL